MTTKSIQVTRNTTDEFFTVRTSTILSDGTYRTDSAMELRDGVLRSAERKGWIRIGGLMTVKLGPISLSAISSLLPGQSITF